MAKESLQVANWNDNNHTAPHAFWVPQTKFGLSGNQISPLDQLKPALPVLILTRWVWISSHHNRSKIQVWCTTICTTCVAKTLNRSCCPHPHDRAQKRNSNHALRRNSIRSGFLGTANVIFTPFTMLADRNHFNMSPANFRMSPSLVLGNNVWPKSLSKQKASEFRIRFFAWEKNISGKRKNLHPIAPWMGKFMGVSHIQSRGIWVWICLSPARPKPLPQTPTQVSHHFT